jgi:hypothetical protein
MKQDNFFLCLGLPAKRRQRQQPRGAPKSKSIRGITLHPNLSGVPTGSATSLT